MIGKISMTDVSRNAPKADEDDDDDDVWTIMIYAMRIPIDKWWLLLFNFGV